VTQSRVNHENYIRKREGSTQTDVALWSKVSECGRVSSPSVSTPAICTLSIDDDVGASVGAPAAVGGFVPVADDGAVVTTVVGGVGGGGGPVVVGVDGACVDGEIGAVVLNVGARVDGAPWA